VFVNTISINIEFDRIIFKRYEFISTLHTQQKLTFASRCYTETVSSLSVEYNLAAIGLNIELNGCIESTSIWHIFKDPRRPYATMVTIKRHVRYGSTAELASSVVTLLV